MVPLPTLMEFSLNVEENATIRISYIGYLEQDVSTEGEECLI